MRKLWIDFETYSECNIRKHGLYRYLEDPTTRPTIVTYAFDNSPVQIFEFGYGEFYLPLYVIDALHDPNVLLVAANLPFDRGVIKHKLGIEVPWERCRDLFTLAYSLSFSGSLEAIGEQIGLSEEKAKIKDGKRLIRKFCSPQPANRKIKHWDKNNAPEDWQAFCEYAKQDVETMRTIWNLLEPYGSTNERTWQEYAYTQYMNERGVPVNMELVNRAIELAELRKDEITRELAALTKLDNPNSPKQMQEWLRGCAGYIMPNMQATTIERVLDSDIDPDVKYILSLYKAAGQTSIKKWHKIADMVSSDGTIKGMYTFLGASRTGRYASRGINIQNLKRPPKGDMDDLVGYIYQGSLDAIKMFLGEPMDFLSKCVRGAIMAPEGQKLVISDLVSIESVVLGWLTNCRRISRIFEEGKDTYKDFAQELFNISYEQVTKDQRTFSKAPVLGCGYFMGAKGLKAYAESMGTDMTLEEAQHAVKTFRDAYPEIPEFWWWLRDTIERVVRTGQSAEGYRLSFQIENGPVGQFLSITLPSGRKIYYHRPQLRPSIINEGTEDEFETISFSYMGINRFNGVKWERIDVHVGGVTENCIQAIARDIMLEWLLRLQQYPIVGTTHDELILPDSDPETTLYVVNSAIRWPMPWAQDLNLNADGFTTKHYTKD